MTDLPDLVRTSSPEAVSDMCAAFAGRLGRSLTDAEQGFVEQLLAGSSIAAESWAWTERFRDIVEASDGVIGETPPFLDKWGRAFGAGYQEMFGPAEALADIVAIEDMPASEDVAVRAYRLTGDSVTRFRFKLYHRGHAAPLADALDILEPMGLKALVEEGFPVRPASGEELWVHEFLVDDPRGAALAFGDIARPFEAAFVAVWRGATENDGFNRLVLEAGAGWRETAAIRALARYRLQTGLDGSQRTQIRALVEHSGITRLLLALFAVKFDPESELDLDGRRDRAGKISREIEEGLLSVPSLEDDRVLRRLHRLILATTRTNFYQLDEEGRPKDAIALKIASRELADLPEPRPFREIFVSSPRMEGVHLRFGPVARGGLRWSDRRDDFRTEVLGLVKAQQVKNAVIVPVGAKGGFIVKGASARDPSAFREAGRRAYRAFLSAMLDVTDNLDARGEPVPPDRLVAHDEPDPYLVVAADKGTAAFSDLANEVSAARSFWLGDAFASGGSAGYDHKAMAITARGAWEAVKRHFRELGKDVQEEIFTVVGVGDMSGDVFGNGMLRSSKTRLLAAFDHRDIFIDPDPDPDSSWHERKRLFELPGSTWQDYDRNKLSKGGTVIARAARSAELSGEARAALGIGEASLSPDELVKAILRAPVDLLYLGGIGTYVKSAGETHLEVADKVNDPVRVDGGELRARVVGEGANLGFTQAGRIEYAKAGGRNNSDAIDNSAGVDSSDIEVNIKILTSDLERRGELSRPERDGLLREMTDDVAGHVLAHNHAQTLALSLLEADCSRELAEHGHFIALLEADGRIDRAVEGLPAAEALEEMRAEGRGLTRPELAVLLAYAKLDFFEDLAASGAPDDPWLERSLAGYFPPRLVGFGDAMRRHRLRREIVATAVANRIVDIAGATFPRRLQAALGCDASAVAIAFAAAEEIFGLAALWDAVDALDNRVPADVQAQLYLTLARGFRQQSHALASGLAGEPRSVAQLVDFYRTPVRELIGAGDAPLSAQERDEFASRMSAWTQAGVPADLAAKVALLPHLGPAAAIAELEAECGRPLLEIAGLHSEIGARLGFHRLVDLADVLALGADPYDGLALRRLKADLRAGQKALARRLLTADGRENSHPAEAVERWTQANGERVEESRAIVERIGKAAGPWTLAKLLMAVSALLKM